MLLTYSSNVTLITTHEQVGAIVNHAPSLVSTLKSLKSLNFTSKFPISVDAKVGAWVFCGMHKVVKGLLVESQEQNVLQITPYHFFRILQPKNSHFHGSQKLPFAHIVQQKAANA